MSVFVGVFGLYAKFRSHCSFLHSYLHYVEAFQPEEDRTSPNCIGDASMVSQK